jgi:hypothetical protein
MRHLVTAAALLALAGPAAAQTTGLPLRNAGVRTGVEVALDLGFARQSFPAPLDDETVVAVGATAMAGLGPAGLSATLLRADRNTAGADRTALTVAGGLRVLGGPLVPLSVTWQAAATVPLTFDVPADGSSLRPWRGSLGLGAALTIPVPVLAITPWIAPRLDYLGRQPVAGSRVKGAVAAGVDLGFLSGLVIRTAYDSRVGWEPGGAGPSGVSVGVGYRFR